MSEKRVSRKISESGKSAGVVVYTDPKTSKKKFASAHDLRRSFASRWAKRVMPATLQLLMRHESIDTTMKYYVGINADEVSKELWKIGETSPLSSPLGSESPSESSPQKPRNVLNH